MAARPLLAFVPLVLTAGATLLLLLLILAGTRDHVPLNQIWFLSADTSSIKGAPSTAVWTLWNVCNGQSGTAVDCGPVSAAYPLQPGANFNTDANIPQDFLNSVNFYYYASRTQFAFFLIAVFFSGIATLAGLLALCSRIGGGLSAVLTFCGLLANIVAAALMTAVWISARNAFNNAGGSANVGVKAFAFAWTSVACLLIATIGFCCACCIGRKDHVSSGSRSRGRFGRRRKGRFDETAAPVNGSF